MTIQKKAAEYADNHGFKVPYDGSARYYDDTDVNASYDGFINGAGFVIHSVIEECRRVIGMAQNNSEEDSDKSSVIECMEYVISYVKDLKEGKE